MDLFKAALNTAQFINQGYNNYNNNCNEDKLRQQLYHCTYNDDTKFIVEKAVKQVLHVYPYFQVQILQFSENNIQKRFLQIKGILEIQVKGKNCKVDYNIMIPNSFPKKPPYVRIINRNPQYMVDTFYQSLRSPTDPKSFILNQKLYSVKGWTQNSSIVAIVIESNKMMRQNFPFYKNKSVYDPNSNVNSGWANLNQSKSGGWSNPTNNQNFNYNPNFSNQGFNNQGFNNQNYNNQGFNNQNYNNMGGFVNPQPPIPFKNNLNINQTIQNSNKFMNESKKILQKIKNEHIKSVEKIQHLQTIRFSLDSEQSYLRGQNIRMSNFLKKNEKSDFSNLTGLIQAKDQKSQQILDLISSIKARQDCITLLQDKFNNDDLQFEEFIKVVKKLQEQKFQDKTLLIKCIQS